MSTPIKGRHSVDAEINAESFEYVFFPVDQNGLCCAVFESWMLGYKHSVPSSKASQRWPTSIATLDVWLNARHLAFYNLKVKACGTITIRGGA